jgi:peptide deformylase
MALREIRTFPDPVLREKALPVTRFDDELKKLARDMAETMYAAPGVGLAANQIGVPLQLIVIDVRGDEGEPSTGLVQAVNPRVVAGDGACVSEEGCLSMPEERADVERYCTVVVEAQDLDGAPIKFEVEGLAAVAFQHEIDHLNGVLFMDHLSPLKRAAMKKRLRKLKLLAAEAG